MTVIAFVYTQIISLVIPNGVTEINRDAFSSCKNLTKITLPNSLTQIGASIFCWSTNLHTIIFKGTKAEWNAINKADIMNREWFVGSSDFTIYCTDGEITKAEAIK